MTINEWPQWVMAGLLILPLITWPLVRMFVKLQDTVEWVGQYTGVILKTTVVTYILYKGGFWL